MSKTITEFDSFRLKNALNTKKELAAAGKTPEEIPAALGEALKLEGDKLKWFLAALELAEARIDNLKRVVVYAAEEGKSAPSGAVQKEDKYFLAEFFYTPQPKRESRGGRDGDKRGGKGGKGRGGKGGRGGGRDGDKRGGGRGGRGGERGRGGDHVPVQVVGGPEAGAAAAPGGGEKREKRGPRPPRAPVGPRPTSKPAPRDLGAGGGANAEQKPAGEGESSTPTSGGETA